MHTKTSTARLSVDEMKQRMKWYIRTRWLVLATVAVPNLLVQFIARSPAIPFEKNLLLAGGVTLYNLGLLALSRGRHKIGYYRALVILQLFIDISAVSYLVFVNGGIESHSSMLYVVPIIASGIFLHRGSMFYTAVFCITMFSLLTTAIYSGVITTPVATNPLLANDLPGFVSILIFIDSSLLLIALVGSHFESLLNKSLVQLRHARHEASELLRTLQDASETQRARSDALFDSLGEGLITVNEYGNITDINLAASKMLGYKKYELLDAWFPKAITAINEKNEIIALAERPILTALETGRPVRARMDYVTKNGKHLPVYVTATPFIINDKPVGGVVVFRDFSQEAAVDQAKDEFVSLASHQLRTPATAVKNFVGLLREGYAGKLTKEQKEYVNYAYESNEYQLNIINDLLNVARAESGRLELKLEEFDMVEFIQKIIHLQQDTIDQRKQKITLEAPPDPVTIKADPEQLRMAFENLVSNASKYTPEKGKLKVTVSSINNAVKVAVADSGVGIAAEDEDKLFKKFSRINNPLSTVVGGTGIGLYLVKRLVNLQKGHIEVQSGLNKGTTFTVTLPRGKES